MESTGNDARQVAVGEIIDPLDFEYEGQREPDPPCLGRCGKRGADSGVDSG